MTDQRDSHSDPELPETFETDRPNPGLHDKAGPLGLTIFTLVGLIDSWPGAVWGEQAAPAARRRRATDRGQHPGTDDRRRVRSNSGRTAVIVS